LSSSPKGRSARDVGFFWFCDEAASHKSATPENNAMKKMMNRDSL